MKLSLILAHPHPGSFNHAIADAVECMLRQCDHVVTVHDLYRERFDPLLPYEEIPRYADLPQAVALHCREIAAADGIVIIHPDWWGMPPAILTGWVDRVLRPGGAYRVAAMDTGDGVPDGLPVARAALVFNTSNTPAAREKQVFGDPLDRLWKDCILSFCGVPVVHRRILGVIVTSTEAQRKAWLEDVREITRTVFPPALS